MPQRRQAAGDRPPIVLYLGPGLSGKSTSLQALAVAHGGEPLVFPVPGVPEATWEFLSLDLGGEWPGRHVHLLAAPGRLVCSDVRRRLLRGADGVVFVVDAREDRLEANLVLLDELGRHLLALGWEPARFPVLLQLNRLDDPGALSEAVLRRRLGSSRVPVVVADAEAGNGVTDALLALLDRLAAD